MVAELVRVRRGKPKSHDFGYRRIGHVYRAMQQVYEQLAQRFEREQEPRQRDNLLVLAADAAFNAGRPEEAERLRRRLLDLNPHHLLRPFESFADALQTPDIREFVADLRRRYPPEYAERLLGCSPGPGDASAGNNGGRAAVLPLPQRREPSRREPARQEAAPRRAAPPHSPYERYELPPLPPSRGFEAWSGVVTWTLFFLVLILAAALAVYVFGRPFWP